MRESRPFSWAALWMVAVAGAGIWALVSHLLKMGSSGSSYLVTAWSALVPLAFVLVVGVVRLVIDSLSTKAADFEPGAPYLRALRGLRQRWLLAFFGTLASVSVIGNLADWALQRHLFLPKLLGANSFPGPSTHPSLVEKLMGVAVRLPGETWGAVLSLRPSMPLNGSDFSSALFAALAVVGIALLIIRRSELRTPSERFFRILLPFASLAFLMAAFLLPFVRVQSYVQQISAVPTQGMTIPPYFRLLTLSSSLWGLLASLLLQPFLLGSALGSLLRGAKGESISARSLLNDGVRYFKPLAGLALMLFAVSYLLYAATLPKELYALVVGRLPQTAHTPPVYTLIMPLIGCIIPLALLFVPFVIVTGGTNFLAGLKAGWALLMRRGWAMAQFIAFAIAILVPFFVVYDAIFQYDMLNRLTPTLSSARVTMSILYTLLQVAISAFTLLAGWELYRAVSVEPTREETIP
ncbi:MAG: hypothetical protein ACYC2Y_09005 [Armatimonadota bacterium]